MLIQHKPRILLAPDKFRGTLTAAEVAQALAAGFRDAGVDDVDELPLADGGEGTLDVLLASLGGELHEAEVTGPDGAPIRSSWGLSLTAAPSSSWRGRAASPSSRERTIRSPRRPAGPAS